MEEDLLNQFRNWTTEEEEIKQHKWEFLLNYWPQMPRYLTRRIHVMVFKATPLMHKTLQAYSKTPPQEFIILCWNSQRRKKSQNKDCRQNF